VQGRSGTWPAEGRDDHQIDESKESTQAHEGVLSWGRLHQVNRGDDQKGAYAQHEEMRQGLLAADRSHRDEDTGREGRLPAAWPSCRSRGDTSGAWLVRAAKGPAASTLALPATRHRRRK
jgi:hypothetical protein